MCRPQRCACAQADGIRRMPATVAATFHEPSATLSMRAGARHSENDATVAATFHVPSATLWMHAGGRHSENACYF